MTLCWEYSLCYNMTWGFQKRTGVPLKYSPEHDGTGVGVDSCGAGGGVS